MSASSTDSLTEEPQKLAMQVEHDANGSEAGGDSAAAGVSLLPSLNGNAPPDGSSSPPPASSSPSMTASSGSSPSGEPPLDPKIVKLKEEGNESFKQKHFQESIQRYTDAIEMSKSYETTSPKAISIIYANRANAYLRTEAYGSAAADARKAIELDNRNPKAYYRLGSAHVALGKFKEGLKVFQVVVKLCPNDKDAKQKLDICQKEVRRLAFEQAIAHEATSLPSEKVPPLYEMEVAASYTGPRWDIRAMEGSAKFAEEFNEIRPGEAGVGGITRAFVEEAVQYMKDRGVLHKKYVIKLLLVAKALLKPLPSLVRISIPPQGKFTVCGDVHGQFYDLLNLFDKAGGRPSRENPFLFNGDFVDRGSFSVEVILTLLLYKALDPTSIHLLRGNHETVAMNKIYGFESEVKAKYDLSVMELFTEVFRYLPLSATLNDKVIVMHGGLFSRDDVTLEEIAKTPRFSEPPEGGLFSDILWSDPQPFPGRGPSKRGVGMSFGPDVTRRFLERNGLELLVRSHEVRDEGYLEEHDGLLITVFSAPNYCDQMGNKGAFIRFYATDDGKGIKRRECVSFTHVPHPSIPPMAYAGNAGFFGL